MCWVFFFSSHFPLVVPAVPTCCCGYPSQRGVSKWSGTPCHRSPGSSWPGWCLRERRGEERRSCDYLKPRLSDSLLGLKASEVSPLLTSLEVWNTACGPCQPLYILLCNSTIKYTTCSAAALNSDTLLTFSRGLLCLIKFVSCNVAAKPVETEAWALAASVSRCKVIEFGSSH